MSPDLAELHPAARPWFLDRDLLLRAVHDGPLSTTPADVSALHQALIRDLAGVTPTPWQTEPARPSDGMAVVRDERGVAVFWCDWDHEGGAEEANARWVAAVRTEAPALLAAVRAVLKPHWPVQVALAYPNTHYIIPGVPLDRWMCVGCLEESIEDCEPGWPCTTVSTLLRTLSEHL